MTDHDSAPNLSLPSEQSIKYLISSHSLSGNYNSLVHPAHISCRPESRNRRPKQRRLRHFLGDKCPSLNIYFGDESLSLLFRQKIYQLQENVFWKLIH